MRIIKIVGNIVSEVKFVGEGYVCRENEYESEIGEIGQRKLSDGTFEDVEPEEVEPEPTLEEMQMQTLLNTEYLVVMNELTNQ